MPLFLFEGPDDPLGIHFPSAQEPRTKPAGNLSEEKPISKFSRYAASSDLPKKLPCGTGGSAGQVVDYGVTVTGTVMVDPL